MERKKNKMKMKLSDYVADFLVKNGIDTMFMITGGGAMHLDDSLGHKEGLHCVYNHNEQGCSVAAEGYTRLTGKLAGGMCHKRTWWNQCNHRCTGRLVRFHTDVYPFRTGKKRNNDLVY